MGKCIRAALIYLTETLDTLTREIEDLSYLRTAFFIWKMINIILRDTSVKGIYWINLKVEVESPDWQGVIDQEMAIAQPYGLILKDALAKNDINLRTKVELESVYFDSKYFMETIRRIGDQEMKMRLLNCLLFYRHFSHVLDKKIPEVFDPDSEKLTLEQKEEKCMRFVRYE